MPTEPEAIGNGLFRVFNDYAQELILNADGAVIEGYGDNGEELDVAGLTYDPDTPAAVTGEPEPEPYVDQAALAREAELQARLDVLEQRANQPVIMVAGDRVEYDGERLVESMQAQTRQLEAMLGRKVTLDERRDLGHEMVNSVRLGDPVDIQTAAERLALEGRGGLRHGDMDSDQERADYYGARLRDIDRLEHQEERNDDLGTPLPPPDEVMFDLSKDGERQQYMVQRLQDQEAYAVEPEEQLVSLHLELGQVHDDATRHALETISQRWPTGTATVAIVATLPPNAPLGALMYKTGASAGLYVRTATAWVPA